MSISMIRFICVCLFVAISSGCSVTRHQNFDPAVVQKDSSVRVTSLLDNEEIVLQFVPSTGGAAASAQFGLIGALVGSAVDAGINNSRAKAAEETIEPFRVALSTVDVRQEFAKNLAAQPLVSPWSTSASISTENVPKSGVSANFLHQMEEQYFVLINTTYHLKPALQVVELYTSYSVWDKNLVPAAKPSVKKKSGTKSSAKLPAALYSNHVTYQSFPYNANKRFLTEGEREDELAAYKLKYPVDEATPAKKRKANQLKVAKFSNSLARKTKDVESYSNDGKVWLENDGELLKKAIMEGVAEVSRIIVADLSGQLMLPAEALDKNNKTTTLTLETKDDGRILEANVSGGLMSRNKDFPLFTQWN